MLKIIKRILRYFKIEVNRYTPKSSTIARLINVLENLDINLVFDIGANEGQFAEELFEHGYRGKIISFEPLSSAREKLIKIANKNKNWIIHEQAAIGNSDGIININVAGNSASSSVLPMLDSHIRSAPHATYVSSEEVPIQRIDSISPKYVTSEDNLFIKIDTQGYEWEVLAGSKNTIYQAKGVLCELSLIPLYSGQKLWRELCDRFENLGFNLWALQKGFTDPKTGQSLQVDGIFVKNNSLN